MSNDDQRSNSSKAGSSNRSIFAVPPALKRVFDRFPLTTYSTNELPACAKRPGSSNTLFIFTTSSRAHDGQPSFNPSCLKWQTYMRIRGIAFDTVASNNHASPSGSLPFVLPAASKNAIAVKALRKWVAKESKIEIQEPGDVRYDAYSSLLDGHIRLAWLYQLYLLPSNEPVMHRLYVAPCSSNLVIHLVIRHQLRQAADAEIKKSTARRIADTELLREADEALAALSTLLGDKKWFFGDDITLFDASVFAYTHLLLDQDLMQWKQNPLGDMLNKYANLVSHRERLVNAYY